jgi:hypothetical protein
LLRRALLGLATALIVVRALVPGEDVGLLEPGGNPMGLAVPLLWLCGLAAWAAWRIWSRQSDWYGGLVEAGLLVVVLFSFVGTATVALYQHPAWVVSWEWAGLLAAFFLVRQLARTPSDQRGLLAVLLATGVSLAAQSLWQRALPDRGHAPWPGLAADELPRLRCEALAQLGNAPRSAFPGSLSLPALAATTSDSDPTLFERIAARNNVRPATGEPALPLTLRSPLPQPPAATFTDEANLAACLALLLPALAGSVLAAWLGGAPRWQTGVALGCALLTALALWLTRVRSAILPCLLVGAVAAVLAWRYYPRGAAGASRGLLLLLTLIGLAALVVPPILTPQRGESFRDLAREWSAAWAMIRDHFWLGVGAGNFVRHYPRHMAPSAPDVARQPDNFVLEVWATLGLAALLGLGLALVKFFRRTLSLVPGQEQGTGDEEPGIRWEFYEGGLVGLVIGFVLRALPLGAQAIPAEAIAAGVRAVIWFAAFALIHGIRWTGATQVLAYTAGVAALLLHLAVAGGISVPGVAQPLFVMAALALNGLPEQPLPIGRQLLGRVLPLVLASAAALLCALQLFEPVAAGHAADRTALAMGQKYIDVGSGVTQSQPDGKTERIVNPGGVMLNIINKLQEAVTADPGNARYWADLADWYGILAETTRNPEYLQRDLQNALKCARKAQELDPLGEAGYLVESRLDLIAARRAPSPQGRAQGLLEAPAPLQALVKAHPNDARLQYRLAVTLGQSGKREESKAYATRALDLDRLAASPQRRLTDPQRKHAERLADGNSGRRSLP